MDNTQQKQRQPIKLITIDNQRKVDYYQGCKLSLNKIAKCLLIEPKFENVKVLVAGFDKTFYQLGNILCIFDLPTNLFNMALLIPKKESCNKLFDIVQKLKDNSGNKFAINELFIETFLIPLCVEMARNETLELYFKPLLHEFTRLFTYKETQQFKQWCQNETISQKFTNGCFLFGVKYSKNESVERKRKFRQISKNQKESGKDGSCENLYLTANGNGAAETDEKLLLKTPKLETTDSMKESSVNDNFDVLDDKKSPPPDNTGTTNLSPGIVEPPNFEIIEHEKKGVSKKHLFIFLSTDRKKCYEYYCSKSHKTSAMFYCNGCKNKNKSIYAKLCKKEDGSEFIELSPKPHICEPRDYNPQKFTTDSSQIIEAPNFEVMKYKEGDIGKPKLIVFSFNDKSRCYEYIWDKYCYFCTACRRLKKNANVKAEICKKDGREYVKLGTVTHICEMKIYISSKNIFDSTTKILTENFKLITISQKGITKTLLIIYDSSNKNLCYEYRRLAGSDKFVCTGCQDNTVSAEICINFNGVENVVLGKGKHMCALKEFDPNNYKNDVVVEKKDFEIVEYFSGDIKKKKLNIFTSDDKKECYSFRLHDGEKYICSKCALQSYTVAAWHCKNVSGNEYISLQDKQHLCQPVKYIRYDYTEKIVKAPNYQLIKRKWHDQLVQRLIIFDVTNRSLCYEYVWSNHNEYYICSICRNKHDITVHAKVLKDSEKENEEYVLLSATKHKCKPQKFVPENLTIKTVKKPNFKLIKTKPGKISKKLYQLIVFHPNDKTLLYVYGYEYTRDCYSCLACRHLGKSVTARIKKDEESGEDYLVLNDAEHVCKPKKV